MTPHPDIATYDKLYAEYYKLLEQNACQKGYQKLESAPPVEAKYDPSFEVPTEVLKAALIIENYTQQNRIIDWEIGGTASRKLVHKLYDQNQELKGILTTLQSERDQLKKENFELKEKLRLELELPTHLLDVHAIADERDGLQAEKQHLSVQLTTANKVIDQCEEALVKCDFQIRTQLGISANHASEALSTIQSLKLKGK